jgi:Eukaryotic translation initiation factor 3 subunit 7 (eIF-3)
MRSSHPLLSSVLWSQHLRCLMEMLLLSVQQMVYTSSVDIRPEWAVVEQIPFTALAKLHSAQPELSDVTFAGQLHFYDKVRCWLVPASLCVHASAPS